MNKDIGPLLKNWKYLPHDINVRIILGQDGARKLQMRIDLGVLQMELDGRPDGRRPYKQDSYLTYFEKRARVSQDQPDRAPFFLTPADCLRLQQESIQYYHRYTALMRLGDFSRVARDTQRNLRVFDFVHQYAKNRTIIRAFEQYRPYVLMMHVRAIASMALEKKHIDEAVLLIDQGIASIQQHYQRYRKSNQNGGAELELLQEWLEDIKARKPQSERERLQYLMDRAIQEEAYETAAKIRDRLRKME
jgi:hypothetical protein